MRPRCEMTCLDRSLDRKASDAECLEHYGIARTTGLLRENRVSMTLPKKALGPTTYQTTDTASRMTSERNRCLGTMVSAQGSLDLPC